MVPRTPWAGILEHIDIAVDRLQRMSDRELDLRALSPNMGVAP
jgi:hypothetical protein